MFFLAALVGALIVGCIGGLICYRYASKLKKEVNRLEIAKDNSNIRYSVEGQNGEADDAINLPLAGEESVEDTGDV